MPSETSRRRKIDGTPSLAAPARNDPDAAPEKKTAHPPHFGASGSLTKPVDRKTYQRVERVDQTDRAATCLKEVQGE